MMVSLTNENEIVSMEDLEGGECSQDLDRCEIYPKQCKYFHVVSSCGEARDFPEPPPPMVALSGDSGSSPDTVLQTAEHNEDTDLQRALQLSLEIANETFIVDNSLDHWFSATRSRHSQQPQSTTRRTSPLGMPTMDSLPNPSSLGTVVQRLLEEPVDDENHTWKDLLGPESFNKDLRNDSIESLLNLVKELPTLLVSTLKLTQPNESTRDQTGWRPAILNEDETGRVLEQLWALVFGRSPVLTAEDFYGWWRSAFHFNTSNSRIHLGLLQYHGGPCGVLASLQCWIFLYAIMLRCALIPSNNDDVDAHSTASLSTSSPTSIDDLHELEEDFISQRLFNRIASSVANPPVPIQPYNEYHEGWCPKYALSPTQADDFVSQLRNIFSPCNCISISSLIWSVCAVLYRASSNSQYKIVVLTANCSELAADASANVRQQEGISGMISKVFPRIYIMYTIQQVYAFYAKYNSELLFSRGGVLGVVLSAILTRGINQIHSEMDDSEAPLIGLYGHSSQELVNLFLSGKTVTNVFDGDRRIGADELAEEPANIPEEEQTEGFKLCGIHRPQLIGYLTELEALRYCEVGRFYKFPLFPVWVVGSPNHFTSIFSLDPRVSRIPSHEKTTQRLSLAFDYLDASSAGIIPSTELVPLLRGTGLSEYHVEAKRLLDPPGQGGVILKMEFLNWAQKKIKSPDPPQPQQHHRNLIPLDPPKKFVLYHYNGQGASGPTLTRVLVEPIDINVALSDDETGLGLVLRTRWKNTLVAALPLLQ